MWVMAPIASCKRVDCYDRAETLEKESEMTLCPVAIAIGCKKCPIFKVCPAKTIIGDQKKEASAD